MDMRNFRLLINGELVPGASALNVVNPATEAVLAVSPQANKAQVNVAVSAAKLSFRNWARSPLEYRRLKLRELADVLETRADEFALLLTEEQGKPVYESEAEVVSTIDLIRYYSSHEFASEVIEDSPGRFVEVFRKPLGVVAAIIPWNFPLLILACKLPPALLVGNTIVVKPAPTTPLTTLLFGEICAEIFPAGVVNILADGGEIGPLLTANSDVAKVSFTGSTNTGKEVMARSARSLKRLTLELGGNDPAIVLDDVSIGDVAAKIFASAFANCGQVCIAVKRAYVHASIYDEMVSALADLANRAIVGNGLNKRTQIGPIQNRMQYERVQGYLCDARKHGKIVAGGDPIDRLGFFVRPAIVSDICDGTRLVDEEQFGPILPVIRFENVDDALERANSSRLGLGGSVWSADRERATSIAQQIDSGTIWVNQHSAFGPHIPLCGAKDSGIGAELGREGLEAFTQISVLNVAK